MTKRDLPPHVYNKKGVLYYERRRGAGWQRQRIKAEFGTPEFWAEYALLQKGTPPAPSGHSFKALIADYRRSDRFTKLAPRTKSDYDKVLSFIEDRLGRDDTRRVKRHHIVTWRDQNTGRFAEYLVQVLRVLFEHALDRGWVEENPARGVGAPKREKRPREPWPDDMVARAREVAEGDDALLFELLVGTGQRIGDVLRIQWGDIDDGTIRFKQGKTGKLLWIPMTERLKALIEATPRRGIFLLLSKRNTPLSYRAAADRMAKLRAKVGAGPQHDIHALRYTTASELAALGCTDEQIESITGHQTRAMLIRYAGEARQRKRASEVQSRRK